MFSSKNDTISQLFYAYSVRDKKIDLEESEYHHCFRVLRKQAGDIVMVVDGKGNSYETIIEKKSSDEYNLRILHCEKKRDRKNYYIHIAICPTKNHSRVEWFVEKAVEIGIDEITFVFAKNTERKKIKYARIQKITISSMKQSQRFYLPKINEMISMKDFLSNCDNKEKYIGHLGDGKREMLMSTAKQKSNYCVLIGPEGDFTSDEIIESVGCGFKPISLGDNRLRTETAGIAACHILNIIN